MDSNSLRDRLEFLNSMIAETTDILKAVAHPVRLKILGFLYFNSALLQDITDNFNIPKTTLSSHLSKLEQSKLLEKLDRGRYGITSEGREFLNSTANMILSVKYHENERRAIQIKRYEELTSRFIGEITMKDKINVEIIKLPDTKVMAVQALGTSPETAAWKKFNTWLNKNHFNVKDLTIYGFNNPNPVEYKEEYGYEFYIPTDLNIEEDEVVKIKEMKGGSFAVTRCEVKGDFNEISRTWKKLINYVKENEKLEFLDDKCYELHPNPSETPDNFILDLYLHVKET